jgi:hypothetical protein
MAILARNSRWMANKPFHEWSDFDYAKQSSQRAAIIPPILVTWIAFVDLCWPQTNFSVLYVIPLVLLARTTKLVVLRRIVGTLVLLTLGIFFLKNSIHLGLNSSNFLNHRLVNRGLVAITIVVVGEVAAMWFRWRAEQSDGELPDYFRLQQREINATLAVLVCAPLVTLIAALDFFLPAHYNLAILYPIPLFVAAWTRSQRVLWATLSLLLLLTFACYVSGTPGSEEVQQLSVTRNRLLAAFGMSAVTFCLAYWMDGDGDDFAP